MIYFPPSYSPAEVEQYAAASQLERWRNPAGEAIGWKRLSPIQPAQGKVLVLHGNGSCAFQGGHYAVAIQKAAPLDVYIAEYPGYENRPGTPSEEGLYAAAEACLGWLSQERPIYVLGESLGTGVASYLAGKSPNVVAGVALLAPYDRLAAVGQAHMRIVPVRLILCDRFPSADHLRGYHGPVGILVGGRDKVVPERFGRRLYDAYQGPKRLWEFPEATHQTLMVQPPAIWRQIVAFWQSHTNSKQ